MQFVVGQRWASHTESSLGLGIIIEAEHRRVTVSYPAAEETRVYATDNAPLSRIKYAVGDTVRDADDQTFTITDVEEMAGIVNYHCVDAAGTPTQLHELDLSCFVQFTTPVQRLFSGQLDKNGAYKLRVDTFQQLHRLQQSPVQGLLGSRTSLLPHQVYIANEVASRHHPRVLLADEVGLGKTIEAGMILHHQLHTGRARRVLILVPDSLVHQWLVEMLRRFNIAFSIFDRSRVDAMEDSENPFDTEQRVLCDLNFAANDPDVAAQILDSSWDMVIVDEAHHLHWSEQEASTEYRFVESLAATCGSLLLLTATPEQVGIDSHFARLRLLDPARFHDLNAFKQEEAGYQALHDLIEQLANHEGELNQVQRTQLSKYLGESIAPNQSTDQLIDQLLDHHGTSRVLFRNTRAAHEGFPERALTPYPLTQPSIYAMQSGQSIDDGLFPEQTINEADWINEDPRVEWLEAKLKSLKPEKVLVICHHASTAVALDKHFNLYAGIRSSSFFEDLSIVERDRAAAYFADNDGGAQVLVCSEIGSEGRNFQFARHLVLFDLPLNPDLIEQRIGRLDRIGQKHTIQVHAPYIKDGAQEVLFRWYHEGLNLFQRSCPAGFAIFERFAEPLAEQLTQSDERLDNLIAGTAAYTQEVLNDLDAGRDRLLELNSCKHPIANALIDNIQQEEQADTLAQYMETVFEEYGVDQEIHSEDSIIVRASNEMQGHFPGLREDGNTITFDREKALSREDIEFLSWEHPMVVESMEMITHSEIGNAAVSVMKVNGFEKGGYLLETLYTIDVSAPKHLQLGQFLPITPTRLLIDKTGKNYTDAVTHQKLNDVCQPVKKKIAHSIVNQLRDSLEDMLNKSQHNANQQLSAIRDQALKRLNDKLMPEIQRLETLQQVNPNIRQDEIDYLKQRMELSEQLINKAELALQAIRVVVNT